MRRFVIVGVVAVLLLLLGCQQEEPDSRLLDMTVKQDRQKEDIDEISRRIEGLETRLVKISETIDAIPRPTGAPEGTTPDAEESNEPRVVEFKDTPEYRQIAAQLAALQQGVSATQSSLTEAQTALNREREAQQRRDPAQAWAAMNDPQQASERLSALGRDFAGKIEDPMRRQEFEVAIENLKRRMSENPSPQELYQRITADLTGRLANEQDERARTFIERQIQSMQNASEEELQGRLERYKTFENMRAIRELQRTYEIPRETLSDAGLPSMGREDRGPGGGGPGGMPGGAGRRGQ